tara:strand:- start:631 stop:1122 length:492 start_codon:yes stop_codon:yes gene_type:complete
MFELAIFLAIVLAISAAHKLARPERMALAMAKLNGMPTGVASTAVFGVAALEFLAATALLFAQSRMIGATFAALIWLTYGVALLRKSGTSLDCGCDFSSREKPVGAFDILRAFGLSFLAVLVSLIPVNTASITTPFAIFGFLALYLAMGELAAVPKPQERRIS